MAKTFNSIKPYSINNPSPSETFGTLETPGGTDNSVL
jgi:hypothetical protein